MEEDTTAGHVGYLTLDEERLLQQCWVHILRLCGHKDIGKKPATVNGNTDANGETAKTNGEDTKSNRKDTKSNGEDGKPNEEDTKSNREDGKPNGDDTKSNREDGNTNGEHSNTNGEHSNTNGEHSSTNGEHSNTNGEHSNTNGEAANTNGEHSNTNGEHSSTNGEHSNTNGEHSNTNGEHSNTNGEAANTNGEHSNTNGEHSSTNGEHSNTNREHSNTNGEAANTNGDASRTNGEVATSNGDAAEFTEDAVTTNGDATKTNGDVTESKDALESKEFADTNGDSKDVADAKGAVNSIEVEPEILRTTPDKTTHFQKVMHHKTPEAFRHGFWEFVKTDHPDSLVLRFLRARKWDPVKAMEMLVSAVSWRSDHNMEETIIRQGEAVALKDSPTKDDINFIEQYRSGKCYVRGIDIHNRPVYSVKVKHHHPHQQSSKTMENFVLHNIESLRVLAREPNDKACLIFDLTGFGLRNMDFHLVKFILEVFEARYPETLALMIVHNAPFVFWGIWSVVKGWMDPVIASKVHFTRKTADLVKFIPMECLESHLGGSDTWVYEYIEPVPGENDKMADVEKRAAVQEERDALANNFDSETSQWVVTSPGSEECRERTSKRNDVAKQLFENYWRLDPYIRTRNYYDRMGALNSDGSINYSAFSGSKK